MHNIMYDKKELYIRMYIFILYIFITLTHIHMYICMYAYPCIRKKTNCIKQVEQSSAYKQFF